MEKLASVEKKYIYHTIEEFKEHAEKMAFSGWECVAHYEIETLTVKRNIKKSKIYKYCAIYCKGDGVIEWARY